jgi:hypothetical protein
VNLQWIKVFKNGVKGVRKMFEITLETWFLIILLVIFIGLLGFSLLATWVIKQDEATMGNLEE